MSRTQLARLIDLPDDALQQVLDYTQTLSKADAVDHLKNLLGDSPAAITFIADFNARRHDPGAATVPSPEPAGAVPRPQKGKRKKKPALHTPAPRQITQTAPPPGAAYNKKNVHEEYIASRPNSTAPSATPSAAPSATPSASSTPPPRTKNVPPPVSKQQQSSAGSLIQDALQPKNKAKTAAKTAVKTTKVTITGGTAMHGASTALADLDAAIRTLEVSTNPTLSGSSAESVEERAARRCHCVATRHPLQTAAPNCLGCGKVICVKEGLGPCTVCGRPLLSSGEVQAMIRELREERGRERMQADRDAHQRDGKGGGRGRGGVAKPTMIAGSMKWGGDDANFVSLAEAKAREHRDRLLGYQEQNAQRTTVRDEAADFDVSEAVAAAAGGTSGRNLWATPEERARELQRQQKLLREMEWNARPEYEKRQQVLSIDITGRKVFRKTMAVERPRDESEDDEDEWGPGGGSLAVDTHTGSGGTFSKNPLLGGLIKPVYAAQTEGQEKGKGQERGAERAATLWRRVQDDLSDNEAILLDGGIAGAEDGDEPGR